MNKVTWFLQLKGNLLTSYEFSLKYFCASHVSSITFFILTNYIISLNMTVLSGRNSFLHLQLLPG